MKIYIAARAKTRAAEVLEIRKKLRSMGHAIAYEWDPNRVKRPYRASQNRIRNIETQTEMLKAAAETDIFILLDESGLRGAYVELGAFLTDCLNNSVGRIAYIVGKDSHEREFIFESPRYVKFTNSIDEVYKDLTNR